MGSEAPKKKTKAQKETTLGYSLLSQEGNKALAFRLFIIWSTIFTAFLVIFLGRLSHIPGISLEEFIPFGAFSLILFIAYHTLRGQTLNTDTRVFSLTIFLVGIGITLQYRMGTFTQGGALGFKLALPVGLLALLLVFLISSHRRWERLQPCGYVAYALAIILLMVMVVFGRRYRGGIYLPGNINPSELIKPLLVIFLAAFLSKRKKSFSQSKYGIPTPYGKDLLLLSILWVIPLVLVFLLHDLGLIILLNAVLIIMLFSTGKKPAYLILGVIGIALIGYLLYNTSGHVRVRFSAWLNPFADPTGGGWQIIQSLNAMYAGGIWGAGIGAGRPEIVPIVSSDFVYAAIAEELGIIISMLILLIYGALLCRGFSNASRIRHPFGELLTLGLTAILFVQIILNLGGVTKALPLTGIVLPFLSQGGSGLIAMLAIIGLLLALSHEDRK